MIKKSEVEFYQVNAGKAYDKNNIENKKTGETLKSLYNKIAWASQEAATSIFGKISFTKLPHAIRSKEHSDIRPYLFTRFSPRNKYSSIATYWFFLEGRPEHNKKHFRISLGLFDNNSGEDLLGKGVALNNEFRLENSIFLDGDISEEDLTQWIVESIKNFELSYDEFCEKLQPDLDDALSKWTERQDKKDKNKHRQNIWKMSHGKEKDISEAGNEWLINNGFVAIGYDPKHNQRIKFVEKMQSDDFFYLVRNAKIILLGQFDGSEIVDTPNHLNKPNWVMRKFKKIMDPVTVLNSNQIPGKEGWKPQNASTVNVVNQSELVEFEKTILQPAFGLSLIDLFDNKEIKNSNQEKGNKEGMSMLNRILYGPPGTGKTFNTINHALSIADPDFPKESVSREAIKKRFDQLIEEGQIVFTTFHQSMSYEDFIEGIKPVSSESEGSLTYEIQPGIFKQICDSALTPNRRGFDAAYKKFQEDLTKLNEDEKFPLTTPTGKEFSISLNSKGNFYLYTGQDKNRQGVLTKENLQKQINGEGVWYQGYHIGVLKHLEQKYGYSLNQKETAKNYVLIIDEINRGNVSQIFGELITLIEDDKRLGKDEGISITLPYSKQVFGVPMNVYIIGTMNTADRSVEALDAALRRRFSFIEMPPNSELIRTEGKLKDQFGMLEVSDSGKIDLANLLDSINQRIEKLLDSDHQIGHSFFLSVDSMSSLKHAFQNKIIPLLKEYFYGDFGKLGLVLGEGFFESTGTSNNSIFAKFGAYDSSDFNERVIYKLKTISSNDGISGMSDKDFIEAIDKLLTT